MFSAEQLKALDAPLARANVKTRSQSGRSLSYIEGWVAIVEANRIFGFDHWDRETVELKLVSERPRKIGQDQREGWSVSYLAKVRIKVFDPEGGVIIREGTGAGHGIDADCGLAHESASKEAETDAMKRALMTFGNPFGLALYDKAQENVEPAQGARKAPAQPYQRGEPMAAHTIAREAAFPGDRKSSAQAKRDGDAERIKAVIQSFKSEQALDDWYLDFKQTEMRTLPLAWEDPISDMVESRRNELLDEMAAA